MATKVSELPVGQACALRTSTWVRGHVSSIRTDAAGVPIFTVAWQAAGRGRNWTHGDQSDHKAEELQLVQPFDSVDGWR